MAYPLDVDQQTAILLVNKIVDKLTKMKNAKQKNNGQSRASSNSRERKETLSGSTRRFDPDSDLFFATWFSRITENFTTIYTPLAKAGERHGPQRLVKLSIARNAKKMGGTIQQCGESARQSKVEKHQNCTFRSPMGLPQDPAQTEQGKDGAGRAHTKQN